MSRTLVGRRSLSFSLSALSRFCLSRRSVRSNLSRPACLSCLSCLSRSFTSFLSLLSLSCLLSLSLSLPTLSLSCSAKTLQDRRNRRKKPLFICSSHPGALRTGGLLTGADDGEKDQRLITKLEMTGSDQPSAQLATAQPAAAVFMKMHLEKLFLKINPPYNVG
jgi:hypothetical protein